MILRYLCYPCHVHLDDPKDKFFPSVVSATCDDAYKVLPNLEDIYGYKFAVRAVYLPSKLIPDVMRKPVDIAKPPLR